jgi:hypothetical protein
MGDSPLESEETVACWQRAAAKAAPRDRALVSVMRFAGARISEAVGLNLDDLPTTQRHRRDQQDHHGVSTNVTLNCSFWSVHTRPPASGGVVRMLSRVAMSSFTSP